jgi:hypothetical protein
LFGARNPSAWLFYDNLRDAAVKISHWFLPYSLSSNPVFLTISGFLLVLIIIQIPRAQFSAFFSTYKNPKNLAVILMIVIYFGTILALTKTEDHVELYDDRYYTPLLIPLTLLLLQVFDGLFLPRLTPRLNRYATWITLALFSVWMIYPAFTSYKLWKASQAGQSVPFYNLYNLPRFKDSAVTRALPLHLSPKGTIVYSNYSAAVYFYTQHLAESSPSDRGTADEGRDLESYTGIWPATSPAILVWFEPNSKKFLFPPKKLGAIFSLDPLFTSRDGGIYRVSTQN